MVERNDRLGPGAPASAVRAQVPQVPEFAEVAPKQQPGLDTHDVSGALRPPFLRFRKRVGPGGPKFEQQAIANLKSLQLGTSYDTIDALARFLKSHGPRIRQEGAARAQDGLDDLEAFVGMNAVLVAMKLGGER